MDSTPPHLDYAPPLLGLGRFRLSLLRPPAFITYLGILLAAAYAFSEYSFPEGDFGREFTVMFAWAMPVSWYCVRGFAALHTAKNFRDAFRNVDTPRYRRRWWYPPVLLVLLLIFTCSGLPATITFHLSRPDMERVAVQVSGTGPIPARTRIGLYRVSDITRVGDGMRFTIAGVGFLDSHGFAYFKSGPPAEEHYYYKHVQGPWYRWTYSD